MSKVVSGISTSFQFPELCILHLQFILEALILAPMITSNGDNLGLFMPLLYVTK